MKKKVILTLLSVVVIMSLCVAVTGIVAAASLPTAEISMVDGRRFSRSIGFTDFDTTNIDQRFLVGAEMIFDDIGAGYDDYLVDCILTLSDSADVNLYGKYTYMAGTTQEHLYPWQSLTGDDISLEAGEIAIMKEAGILRTVTEARDEVGDFFCALTVDPYSFDTELNVKIRVVIYEAPEAGEEPVYIDVKTNDYSIAVDKTFTKALPDGAIQFVSGNDFATTTGFESFPMTGLNPDFVVGAVVSLDLDNPGYGYEDYIVDCVLTISEDVSAKVMGSYTYYGGETPFLYDWQGTDFIDIAAGSIAVMQEAGITRTLEETADEIRTFYCALAIDPYSIENTVDVGLGVSLCRSGDLLESFINIEGASATQTLTKELPTAGLQMVSGVDFATTEGFTDFPFNGADPNYVIGAILTLDNANVGTGYEDYMVDCLLNLSQDVTASLLGSYTYYGGATPYLYEWQGMDDVELEAGSYAIMKDSGIYRTLQDTQDDIRTFYCAFVVDPYSLTAPLDVSLDVKLYRAEDTVPQYIDLQMTDTSTAVEATYNSVLPRATVTQVAGTDFASTDVFSAIDFNYNPQYSFGAVIDITDKGLGYDSYLLDTLLTTDAASKAVIMASTDGLTWINADGAYADLAAGEYATPLDSSLAIADADKLYVACMFKSDSIGETLNASIAPRLNESAATPAYIAPCISSALTSVEAQYVSALPTGSAVTTVATADFATADVFNTIDTTVFDISRAVGFVFTVTDTGIGYDDYCLGWELTSELNDIKGSLLVYKGTWQMATTAQLNLGTAVKTLAPATPLSQVTDGDTVYCAFIPNKTSLVENASLSIDMCIYESDAADARRVELASGDSVAIALFRELVVPPTTEPDEEPVVQPLVLGDTSRAVEKILLDAGDLDEETEVFYVIKDKDDLDSTIRPTAKIGTGMYAVVENIETGEVATTRIVIKGDVDGDGDCDEDDINNTMKMGVGVQAEDEIFVKSADIDDNGVVNGLDAMFMELYGSGNMSYGGLVTVN